MIWALETVGTVRQADSDLADSGWEWAIDVKVPQEAYAYYMEELIVFRNTPVEFVLGSKGYPWTGVVEQRYDLDGVVEITIGFNTQASPPIEGEDAKVYLETLLDKEILRNLVPVSAVHHDPFHNTHYIYSVQRRDGVWGREFVAVREVVTFGIPSRVEDLMNIVYRNSDGMLPVVAWSDQPLYNGAVVRLFD